MKIRVTTEADLLKAIKQVHNLNKWAENFKAARYGEEYEKTSKAFIRWY